MKIYIASRFKGADDHVDVEALCSAVRAAGFEDYCFVRDVVEAFEDPRHLWQRALEEIKHCDELLIDVSDAPSGGRVVEAGIAYALGLPIITICKNNIEYKELYDGISDLVIRYDGYDDISPALSDWVEHKK